METIINAKAYDKHGAVVFDESLKCENTHKDIDETCSLLRKRAYLKTRHCRLVLDIAYPV